MYTENRRRVQNIKKPNSFNLPWEKLASYRILPYKRPRKRGYDIGHLIAYHFHSEHNLNICRNETLDRPCLFCEINKKRENFSELVFRLLVNAVEVKHPDRVFHLLLPKSVFGPVLDYYEEDDEDIFDPKRGRIIRIGSSGGGYERKYIVEITNDTFPIDYDAIIDQIIDPVDEIEDPGDNGQNQILADLFKNWSV